MRKEIPEPNSKTSLIIAEATRVKADEIALSVRKKAGKTPSLALIVHHLIAKADARQLANELAAEMDR